MLKIKFWSKTLERFWVKVVKRGEDECWEWLGAKNKLGYGTFFVAMSAHKFSYELANGLVPEGLCVCHKRDNPNCVNPNHLFVGTYQDNRRDCAEKGRFPRGEDCKNAKIAEWQIPYIRMLLEAGIPKQNIGAAYGVRDVTILRIARGQTWAHTLRKVE